MNTKIKGIEFILENCEGVYIPFECFKEFKINGETDIQTIIQKNSIHDCTFKIIGNGQEKYIRGFNTTVTPLQRLAQYNDVCYIEIYFTNGDKIKMDCWHGNMPCDNEWQSTIMHNYNEITLAIEPKKYIFKEILEFPIGSQFLDKDDNLYTLKQDNCERYIELPSKNLSLKQLNMKYKLINGCDNEN